MSETPSNMLPLGTEAPDFTLLDTVSGKKMSLSDISSPVATVIMFICNHCPYVIHVNNTLISLANEYSPKDISFVAISSNDATKYPQDGPDKMKSHASTVGYPFPYLYDETQEIAKAYHAACTPDIYVFDKALKLVYRGQLDGARPGNQIPNDGCDLKTALDCTLSNTSIDIQQKPSCGCNIKWKTS